MAEEFQSHLKDKIKRVPTLPGVYQYFNNDGEILYIGKAKNLRNRVRSYFSGNQLGKTRILVRKIHEIKFIVVDDEQEALLLENSLIKKYQPPYNIQLKDDKTFPWLLIRNERFPRLEKVRKVVKNHGEYFGPFSNVRLLDALVDLIHQLYPLRNCSYDLSKKNVADGKFRVCLEYHVGNCAGPCVGKEEEEDYNAKLDEIKTILKGNIKDLTKVLTERMKAYSDKQEYEKAQAVLEKIEQIKKFRSKNTVVNAKLGNIDVFGVYTIDEQHYVNFLRVIDGAIVQGHTVGVKPQLGEELGQILERVMLDFFERFNGLSKHILVPVKVSLALPNIKCSVPIRGDKKKLLDMSTKNAKYFGTELKLRKTPKENFVLKDLQQQLKLKDSPVHIECFDNSNIQGTNPTSACVVFKDGKPSKKDYRIFNIKSVEGPNDFASMEEVVFRRYSRLLSEQSSLPQLLIIDGGKGQLSAAVKSLNKLNLYGKIAVIGIAKRLEEIYFPGDSLPLYIDKRASSLKLIQHLRNEAHRFSLKAHRNRRSKELVRSELDSIKGIGEKTKQQLLVDFGSVKKIASAKYEEVVASIGKSKAKIITDYFKNKL